MSKPQWSNAQIIAQLDSGSHWSGTNLTYRFPSDGFWLEGGETDGFTPLNATQKAVATAVIKLWDDLINPDFSLTQGANSDIKIANTTTAVDYAHAYYPGAYNAAGSVWFDPTNNSGTNNLATPKLGEWGYQVFIHEIGHALGLDHPGEYNGGDPTYSRDAHFKQDSQQYTVMSYFEASETGADWIASDGREYNPQTPMLYDVLTIQSIYGAETTTRSGKTVYGYGSNAGNAVYDFAKNPHPVICIYDAGGTDTLDLSLSKYGCTLDLNPGAFSNTDKMTSNISIAFETWIENAIGGKAGDKISGNKQNNALSGLAGNDKIYGAAGNDKLSGGDGNDLLQGNSGKDELDGGTGKDTLTGGLGADVFRFASANHSTRKNFDVISDFSAAEGDHVDLRAIDANSRVSGDQTFSFLKSAAFTGKAGQLYFKDQHLVGDVNGDKAADLDIHLASLKILGVGDIWL